MQKRIDIANYIVVCMMYLKDNLLLEREINESDLKENFSGHWGTTPAFNFIYAHLDKFIKENNLKTLFVCSTGHAGAPLLANLYIDGELEKFYPQYTNNYDGFLKLVNSFGSTDGFRTEINPEMPYSIYSGGELGYGLAVSFGASLDNKNLFIPCIIGDGEAETGTTSASWQLIKYMNNNYSGLVLPILNLNGKKMGSDSVLSTFSNDELEFYFSSFGYEVLFVNGKHEEMNNALNKVIADIKHNYIIILKTPKGWTAPDSDILCIENKLHAHKNPLHILNDKEKIIKYLNLWLKSYKVNLEMNENEIIKKEIRDNFSHNLNYLVSENVKLNLPNINDFYINENEYKNVTILSKYIAKTIEKNNNFRIFSPDELVSNGFSKIFDVTKNNLLNDDKEIDGKVIEILNENICQALMQGYVNTGRNACFIGYEAFMPIIDSMISQLMKHIYESRKQYWKVPHASYNYILTSTCYENNYSHQNPEFINTLLDKNYDFTNVYLPPDANTTLLYCEKMLKSSNEINVLIASKGKCRQYLNLEEQKILSENGAILLGDKSKKADVVIACSGDYVFEEGIETYKLLKEIIPNIRVNLVYVSELRKLKKGVNNSFSDDEFYSYFDKYAYTIYLFHGYESVIRNLIYERDGKYAVIGYKDKSDIAGNRIQKLKMNGINRNEIINRICLNLLENGKIVLNLDFIKLFKEVKQVGK